MASFPAGVRPFSAREKLFEKSYGPLTAGILAPFKGDAVVPLERTSRLDTLYRAVTDALDRLVGAVGLKAA